MSELTDVLRSEAEPALRELSDTLANDFTDGLQAVLEGADDAARSKVADLVKLGFSFKQQALTAKTAAEARMYAGEVATAVRRIRTVLIAESIVAQDSIASLIADLFEKALDGLGKIAVSLISTLATAAVKGVIESAGEGGGDFDPASIFPFA